jgi:hypothetical protein
MVYMIPASKETILLWIVGLDAGTNLKPSQMASLRIYWDGNEAGEGFVALEIIGLSGDYQSWSYRLTWLNRPLGLVFDVS